MLNKSGIYLSLSHRLNTTVKKTIDEAMAAGEAYEVCISAQGI
jgi:hypothetical protein